MRRFPAKTMLVAAVLVAFVNACSTPSSGEGLGVADRSFEGVASDTAPEYARTHSTRANEFFGTMSVPDQRVPSDFQDGRRLLGSCLEGFGFRLLDADSAPGTHMIVAEVPFERQSEYAAAFESCKSAAVASGFVFSEDDPRVWTQRYQAWQDVHECLLANGFASEPPPADESLLRRAEWHPFSALLSAAGDGDPSTAVVVLGSGESPEVEALVTASSVCQLP